MSAVKTCTATFEVNPVIQVNYLEVILAGVASTKGRVTSVPNGIDCSTVCNKSYATGTTVTLLATPTDASSIFSSWGGDCVGVNETVSVTMSAAKSCIATFDTTSVGITHELSMASVGSGSGIVTSSPIGINCGVTCKKSFVANTAVTLTATAAVGSQFDGWTGTACQNTVTMTRPRSCTATFSVIPSPPPGTVYTLLIKLAGSGTGTVMSLSGSLDCPNGKCSLDYNPGQTVRLTVTPLGSSVFGGWSGSVGCANTLVMNSNMTCTATFN